MHVKMTHTMTRQASFPLYDRILGGTLAQLLTGLRAEGLTGPAIRDRLRDEHAVDVSAETVRRWLNDLASERAS